MVRPNADEALAEAAVDPLEALAEVLLVALVEVRRALENQG